MTQTVVVNLTSTALSLGPSIVECHRSDIGLLSCHNEVKQTSGFNNRRLFSLSSGGWKSKIKRLAGLVPSEASLLGLQTASFSLCPRGLSSVHVHGLCLFLCVYISTSYEDASQIRLGPTLMTLS